MVVLITEIIEDSILNQRIVQHVNQVQKSMTAEEHARQKDVSIKNALNCIGKFHG